MASLIPWQQIRTNTVNFFMRRNTAELWKTITSVSKSGQKKGRRSTRQPIRNVQRYYRIGSSPMKIQYPGLNAPIDFEAKEAVVIEESNEEQREEHNSAMRKHLEETKGGKRRFREKLHPLERGFSGTQIVGQKLGPPPPKENVAFDDFETFCLEVKRTCNMTRVFGRVHTMAALVAVGNGQGLAGYAVGKAPIHRTTTAIVNGMNLASRKMFFVELYEGRTIYQLIGIKDIYVKVEGSTKNYLALTHAFITGLLHQETHQQLAERKGLHVVEMEPPHFYPQIVASPIETPEKTEDELSAIDRLNLDDFYGEGRYPLKKNKPPPFYSKLPEHLEAEWRKHPYRNQEKPMLRLLGEGIIERWTRTNRKNWGVDLHEKAVAGVIPIPTGIGLSDIVDNKKK